LNVRSKLLEAYRVLAFPRGSEAAGDDLFGGGQGAPLLECYRVDFGEIPEASTPRRQRNIHQAVAEGPILQCLRENNKLVPESSPERLIVLAPEILRRPPVWKDGERRLATAEIWDRLRREPALPIILRETDLLPTLRAGATTSPEALWIYYNQPEKKVYTRENAAALSPVIAPNHFLYEVATAIADRIMPVTSMSPQEVWDYLWPREGVEPGGTVSTIQVFEAARESAYFPVLPERSVLWQALQEGTRENRWVLYLRGPNLAIGAQEMSEWPGTPRFDDTSELWTYQAALDQGIYPRRTPDDSREERLPLTPATLRAQCWPGSEAAVATEELERLARGIWPDLSRPRLEEILREGVQAGAWAIWRKGTEETFFTREDTPPFIRVAQSWVLVDPDSSLAQDLAVLRPGRGPQPVVRAGTPREALTLVWEDLVTLREIQVCELTLTVTDRDSFDNTLIATWADRPQVAQVHASVIAHGQRENNGKQETVHLEFAGRFEELRTMLSPIWPFQRQGGALDITIVVRLTFDPAIDLPDTPLETYRTALMNANQGTLEARVVPVRARKPGGGA
jgi:hypothetical protein